MPFCNYCGAKNEEGTSYCIKCGKPLQTDVGAQEAPRQEAPRQNATSGNGWYIRDNNLIISTTDMSLLKDYDGGFPWKNAVENVKSVIFVAGVTKIEQGAFDGFVNLESVMMPNDVCEIQKHAFRNCKKLKSITIPDCNYKKLYIQTEAFEGCESLSQVIFLSTMPIMEEGVFAKCRSINTVEFQGKTYDSIGKMYEAYLGIGSGQEGKE